MFGMTFATFMACLLTGILGTFFKRPDVAAAAYKGLWVIYVPMCVCLANVWLSSEESNRNKIGQSECSHLRIAA
jgi:hypothetical protein